MNEGDAHCGTFQARSEVHTHTGSELVVTQYYVAIKPKYQFATGQTPYLKKSCRFPSADGLLRCLVIYARLKMHRSPIRLLLHLF